MKIKYLVKGKVLDNFILRGIIFRVGDNLNLAIYEKELQFIKTHCEINSITDYEVKETETLNKVLENKNNGGIKNELPKTRNRKYKGKN